MCLKINLNIFRKENKKETNKEEQTRENPEEEEILVVDLHIISFKYLALCYYKVFAFKPN